MHISLATAILIAMNLLPKVHSGICGLQQQHEYQQQAIGDKAFPPEFDSKADFCNCRGHPCCCDKPCCQGNCLLYRKKKFGDQEYAYLKYYGTGPGLPCCGANCTSSQCLKLVLAELAALEKPLDIQQSRHKPVPDEERCCGPDCEDAQCLQDIHYTFIDLQNPARLSLENSTKEEYENKID